MTKEDSDRPAETTDRELSHPYEALLQVTRELEGLKRLEDLVPTGILWDRPPGLPSGAELLWLLHLVDTYVFTPSVESRELPEPPDYAGLLATHPCRHETLDDLVADVTASREALVAHLEEAEHLKHTGNVKLLVNTVVSHDRHILSAFTERLYESGLGR